jgi:1-acyl-sn-glycerol-3-phosphate acyltransferase
VPIIPVAMFGTDKANPIGSKMWYPHPIRIKIGKPLDFSRYQGMDGDRFIERSITDEVMYALMELSGQEYVDVYAAKLKEAEPAVPPAPRAPVEPTRADKVPS